MSIKIDSGGYIFLNSELHLRQAAKAPVCPDTHRVNNGPRRHAGLGFSMHGSSTFHPDVSMIRLSW